MNANGWNPLRNGNPDISSACVTGNRSRVLNISWNNDKYPDAPVFTPRKTLTVMDEDGPGMITTIHASGYSSRYPDEEDALWIRVYYDFSETPAIDMPLVAFMGDPECLSEPFATEYFSKFDRTHNMYLLMPYKKHIRIELENMLDRQLSGATFIQFEPLDQWNESLGELHVQYREADLNIPTDVFESCNVQGNGTLVAHWMHLKANNPLCQTGQYVCEANDEFYIDGEDKPSVEYIGTEDMYGNSWGFNGICSDGRSAIICEQGLETGDLKLTMLRCRVKDRIRFHESLRLVYDYRQEFFSKYSVNPLHAKNPKVDLDVSYKSGCYYYQIPEE